MNADPNLSDSATIVVACVCGQRWEGATVDVIAQVRQHGVEVHNMAVTAEEVLAMKQPSDRS